MTPSARFEPAPRGPLDRTVRVEDIPAKGLSGRLEADSGERIAVAEALSLVSVEALSLDYELKRIESGNIRLNGTVSARCIQSCVITLEPLPTSVAEPVDVEFWPADALGRQEQAGGEEILEIDPEGPEPIVDGRIDLGQLAYEILASSLDPYPRRPGAAFEWTDPAADEDRHAASPFAILKDLKRKDN